MEKGGQSAKTTDRVRSPVWMRICFLWATFRTQRGEKKPGLCSPEFQEGEMKGPILFLLQRRWDCTALEARGACSGSRCFNSCRGASLHRLFLTKVPGYKMIHNTPPQLFWSWISVLYNLQPVEKKFRLVLPFIVLCTNIQQTLFYTQRLITRWSAGCLNCTYYVFIKA